ncbi:hypothetical protein EYC84_006085 [Monilinia fructicola]|uniref:peptidylprolyl isomerase n=1 Tax=Monilinia fructicola TaxID=38448 RepID=A0A5M9K4S1_MONFR|nr:hypothetical protein EYC84_006085 [Monilinia fructicola]
MRLSTISFLALASSNVSASLKKEIRFHVHYRGNLEENGKVGKEFDASYNRGQPLSFVVGRGSVIKGWDDNLIDIAMGPIPAKSTLIFETELMGIEGVPTPETIIEKTSSAPDAATDSASSLSDKATDKATEAATGGAQRVVDSQTNSNGERILRHGHEAPHNNGHEL